MDTKWRAATAPHRGFRYPDDCIIKQTYGIGVENGGTFRSWPEHAPKDSSTTSHATTTTSSSKRRTHSRFLACGGPLDVTRNLVAIQYLSVRDKRKIYKQVEQVYGYGAIPPYIVASNKNLLIQDPYIQTRFLQVDVGEPTRTFDNAFQAEYKRVRAKLFKEETGLGVVVDGGGVVDGAAGVPLDTSADEGVDGGEEDIAEERRDEGRTPRGENGKKFDMAAHGVPGTPREKRKKPFSKESDSQNSKPTRKVDWTQFDGQTDKHAVEWVPDNKRGKNKSPVRPASAGDDQEQPLFKSGGGGSNKSLIGKKKKIKLMGGSVGSFVAPPPTTGSAVVPSPPSTTTAADNRKSSPDFANFAMDESDLPIPTFDQGPQAAPPLGKYELWSQAVCDTVGKTVFANQFENQQPAPKMESELHWYLLYVCCAMLMHKRFHLPNTITEESVDTPKRWFHCLPVADLEKYSRLKEWKGNLVHAEGYRKWLEMFKEFFWIDQDKKDKSWWVSVEVSGGKGGRTRST